MILHLALTFLAATSTYHLYGSSKSNDSSAINFTITDFDLYQDQSDLDSYSNSTIQYHLQYYKQQSFNGHSQEYLSYFNYFQVTDYVNANFGLFNLTCKVPDEVLASFPELNEYDDEDIFELNMSFLDEDFGNHSVIGYYPNIHNFLTNCEIHINFDFFVVYASGEFEYLERSNYNFDVPLWVQDYGGETYYRLSAGLDDQLNWVLTTQDYRMICAYTITFTMVDMNVVKQYWYEQGYYNGKNDGIVISGENNFWKLFTAVIDTPILYLRKFFGYEVLGINLYAALATVMSLLVALAVFKAVRSFI